MAKNILPTGLTKTLRSLKRLNRRGTFADFTDQKAEQAEREKLPQAIRGLARQIMRAEDDDVLPLAKELAALVSESEEMEPEPEPVEAAFTGAANGFSRWVDQNMLQA
jgi:hypothetical protein